MALTTSQSAIYQRIRVSSSSKQAISLSDSAIRVLIYIAARDLGVLNRFPEAPDNIPNLFSPEFDAKYPCPGPDPRIIFERICYLRADADTYVACLGALHKARLKYGRVLSTQPFARMDQVGPRGLLQYGLIGADALAALLVWRKWIYDIDNRAAQDTGYLVEPVIAGALGGVSFSARNSPVKRRSDSGKGRQVDCIKDSFAYEFKLRMTIAASGQGRWSEELEFVEDCKASGFTPILIVLDPTESAKLVQLKAAFERAGGLCYIGEKAWEHLYHKASRDMAIFLKRYLEEPLSELFLALPQDGSLPSFTVHLEGDRIQFLVGGKSWEVERQAPDANLSTKDDIPDGAGDFLPGF